jgi:hypothetical protein
LARQVAFEEPCRIADGPPVAGLDPKAAARAGVRFRVVEAEQIQGIVNEQVFAVVLQQIVAGTAHYDARGEQSLFELSEIRLAAAVGVRHQGADSDAALDRCREGGLNLRTVEAEDRDVDLTLRSADRLHHGNEPRLWLDHQVGCRRMGAHDGFFAFFSSHCTARPLS